MTNIGSHLKKQYWRRRIVDDATPKPPTNAFYYEGEADRFHPEGNFQHLTNEDFAREIEQSAHGINSRYQSTRPIKEAVQKKDKNGNPLYDSNGRPVMDWEIVGYDELETVRFGYQKRFAMVKASHFAADGFWIASEDAVSEPKHRLFDLLGSWKDMADLNTMLMELALSTFQVGDAGVYVYATADGRIEYKVYSYLDGYQLFPDLDENRNPVCYVLYTLKGKRAVDFHSVNGVETWVEGVDADKDESWLEKVRNWFKTPMRVKSEDGWVRVSSKESQVPQGCGQFFYFRIPDIPSGCVQSDIEAAERSASFVAEGVKSATFDTLFVKATSVESLPPVGAHGSVLAVKGDAEALKASDAKRLAPSNISDVAKVDLENKMNSILHSTMSVIVEPEILRSGADSSSAMRLCFVSEIQWCQTMWPHFAAELRRLMNTFKFLVAKVEGNPEIADLRISVGQNIWIPANRGEQVEQTTKMVYAGLLSTEAGSHELDLQYPNDEERIRREAEDKIYRETYVRLKAEAQARKDFPELNVQADAPKADPSPKKEEGDPNKDNNDKR